MSAPRAAATGKEERLPSQRSASLLAGGTSGLISSALLQPFDVIKTRIQAHKASAGVSRGMVAIARDVVKKEGVGALWSGVGPACLRVGGGAALYFACLDHVDGLLKHHFKDSHKGNPVLSTLRTFTLGAVSRSFAAIVFCPVTVVKTRMEYAAATGIKYSGTAHALLTIAREERLRGLYSGLGATLLRDAPYSGIYLLLFTRMREQFDLHLNVNKPTASFAAAAISGGLATLLTHPPDIIRTRIQLRRVTPGTVGAAGRVVSGAAAAVSAAAAAGPATTLLGIARTEGLAALWSGVTPRIARRTLQQALTWTMFEQLVRSFGGVDTTRRL